MWFTSCLQVFPLTVGFAEYRFNWGFRVRDWGVRRGSKRAFVRQKTAVGLGSPHASKRLESRSAFGRGGHGFQVTLCSCGCTGSFCIRRHAQTHAAQAWGLNTNLNLGATSYGLGAWGLA